MKQCHLTLGVLGAALLLGACDDSSLKDKYYGRLVYEVLPDTAQGASQDPGDPKSHYRQFVLSEGYVGGKVANYLDLGPVTTSGIPNVYVPMHGGKPIPGQYPIIDTLPDQADYSSVWHIVQVDVPASYEANDVKSLAGIQKNKYSLVDTSRAMYCAVVNPDATWFMPDGATPLFDPTMGNVFYGTNEDVANPAYVPPGDAGPTDDALVPPVLTDKNAGEADLRLPPVWHKRLLGFCFPGMTDAQRSREFVAEPVKGESGNQTGWGLAAGGLGRRVDFYTQPDPDTGEQGPWGVPPVFDLASADPKYSPIVEDLALATDEAPTALTLEGLDVTSAADLGPLDNPLILETDPAVVQ